MNRKTLLKSGMALLPILAAQSLISEDHDHHDGHGNKYKKAVHKAQECIQTGLECHAHCLTLLAEGDKGMAACAKSVLEMTIICDTFVKYASMGSGNADKIVKLCIEICQNCEKECNKHSKKHKICAGCAKSCADCISELKKINA